MGTVRILAAMCMAMGLASAGSAVSAPAGPAPDSVRSGDELGTVILVDSRDQGERREDWRRGDRRRDGDRDRRSERRIDRGERDGDRDSGRRAERRDRDRDRKHADHRDGHRRGDWRHDHWRRDDWRRDDWRRDDWRRGDRRHHGWDRGHHHGWRDDGHPRGKHRYEVRRWRAHHHPRHRHWVGRRLPRVEYVIIHEYRDYDLPRPRRGHYYVRHDSDVYLVAKATRKIVDAFVLLHKARVN